MRKLFSELLFDRMDVNPLIHLCTADLGYGLWDKHRSYFKNRVTNFLSSEQLMIGAAAGLSLENKIPICYSITPFLLFRPFEFIRNYLDHDKIPVKLVGGGRSKDYGYLGFSHWADDDVTFMANFKNIKIYYPSSEQELKSIINEFLFSNEPCYLNLKK